MHSFVANIKIIKYDICNYLVVVIFFPFYHYIWHCINSLYNLYNNNKHVVLNATK